TLRAPWNAKTGAYLRHAAGTIHAAEASARPTPAAATLARTAVVLSERAILLRRSGRCQPKSPELRPQRLARDAGAPGRRRPTVAVLPQTALDGHRLHLPPDIADGCRAGGGGGSVD